MEMDPMARHEVVERGQRLYEEVIRPRVEPACTGQFVVLDADSGDYEVDADKLGALTRLTARRPQAVPYIVRVGRPAAVSLGPMGRGERR
jgi:hypothetical protein